MIKHDDATTNLPPGPSDPTVALRGGEVDWSSDHSVAEQAEVSVVEIPGQVNTIRHHTQNHQHQIFITITTINPHT